MKRDADGRPFSNQFPQRKSSAKNKRSGRRTARQMVQHRAHDVIFARLAYVGRAQTQCLGPQLVVRQSVGADDAKVGELMMQALDFVRPRSFQIQHHRLGAVLGNRGTDLLVSGGQINRIEVLGETDRQSLCSSGVILIKDYTEWFHTHPPDLTAIRGGLGCDSKLLAQSLSTPSATALLAQRFLGRGLERFSLELSVLF